MGIFDADFMIQLMISFQGTKGEKPTINHADSLS